MKNHKEKLEHGDVGNEAAGNVLPLSEGDVRDWPGIRQELAEMQQLAQEIAAAWVSPRTGVELVAEQRR